jgi:hypothetical protein
MKPIATAWFKHLPVEEQEEFKKSLRASHRILDRLKTLLIEDVDLIANVEEKDDTYTDGYPYKQAFLNGRRKSLKHVLDYLSFLED